MSEYSLLRPRYPFARISSYASLCRMLRQEPDVVKQIARHAEAHYGPGRRIKKKDGSIRATVNAKPRLKWIQGMIQSQIFRKVLWPGYLQGGIYDPKNPRDSVRNAQLHVGRKILINEDIKDFFPSTPPDLVFRVWHSLLGFSEEVSRCLTELTTLNGQLPQGAKTSTFVANLVLWEREPDLVVYLRSKGLQYSRYIDDITISSKAVLCGGQIQEILSCVRSMCRSYGYRLNSSKHSIRRSSRQMVATGVVVNRRTAAKRKRRSEARQIVHDCEVLARQNPSAMRESWYCAQYNRVVRKLGYLSRLNPTEARSLWARLEAVKPCGSL